MLVVGCCYFFVCLLLLVADVGGYGWLFSFLLLWVAGCWLLVPAATLGLMLLVESVPVSRRKASGGRDDAEDSTLHVQRTTH